MKKIIKIIFILLVAITANNAHAMMYGFDCFTNNNATNCNGTDSIFSVSVAESDPGEVTFTISHSDSLQPFDTGEITEIYFDGATTELGMFISSNPMWNTAMVAPPELPSQNTANPAFVTDFQLDSDFTGQTPDQPIGPGEDLNIVFALNDTLANLLLAIDSGDLRIGLHVRSIQIGTNDSSESFVSTVPVPAAVWMLGSGILVMMGFRKRPI